MQVILDTNIIVSDLYMKSSKFRLLFEFSKKIPFDILIPEVVIDEVIHKYSEMFKKQLLIYEKSISQLKPFLYGRNHDFLTFDITMQEESYRDYLNDLVKNEKVKLIPYPETKHKSIVLHELSGKKPFKDSGAGYRDMLIIDSICEKFKFPEESIIFISNNSNDFGIEPNFHEDLFFGKEVSNKFRFKIKNSLTSFLKEYITPIMKIDKDIETIPQMSEIAGFNISNWVLEEMKNIINDNGISYAIMGLEEDYGTVMLHKIDSVKSISIADVIKVDDKTITCNVIIDGIFIMYVSGNEYDFMRSESWREFFAYNGSEGIIDMWCWPQASAKITISIVIDIAEREINSYSPILVEGEKGLVKFDW